MERERIINSLKTLRDKGECVSQTLVLDEAIKLIERKKAYWIAWTDDRKDYVFCSACDYGVEGEVLLGKETNFCPCCGAEMEEVK